MSLFSRSARDGLVAIMPLLPAAVPFGMVTGVVAADAGLGPVLGIGYSVFVFAGASQLAMMDLLLNDGWVPVIILTGLVINLRFAMYSASLVPHLGDRPFWQRAAGSFLMTDQAYGLSVAHFLRHPNLTSAQKYGFYIGAALLIGAVWDVSSALGYVLGSGVPKAWRLEFAAPLSFIALVVPALRDRPSVVAALVSGSLAVALHEWPLNLGLFIAAAIGIISGYFAETRQRRRMRIDGAA